MVVGVGEPKVGSVPHGGDFGSVFENPADFLVRAINACLGSGDQADGSDIGNYGDLLIGGNLFLDLLENSPVATEEGLMDFGAGSVPLLQRMSFTHFDLMNFAFHRDNPFRHDRGLVLPKDFSKTFPGASGGHDPWDGPFFTTLFKPVEKIRSQWANMVFPSESSVKIGADQEGLQRERFSS